MVADKHRNGEKSAGNKRFEDGRKECVLSSSLLLSRVKHAGPRMHRSYEL
jgi:hypothetical protein